MRSLTILLVCLFSGIASYSQSFRTIVSAGLAAGQSPPQFLYQGVAGLEKGNWFTGIGLGVDNYEIKSLPLFADVRYALGHKKQFFIYGDAGYGFALKKGEKSTNGSTKYRGGLLAETGGGLLAPLGGKVSLVISLGYSHKRMGKVEQLKVCPIYPPCFDYNTTFDQNFNRIVLKTGLRF